MVSTYTDYVNKIAITVPDTFINVKTGESLPISPKIQEQIEYHANNSTLMHLVFSALNHYLHPQMPHRGTEEILFELSEIKKMMQNGVTPKNYMPMLIDPINQSKTSIDLDMRELEEVLDAFGG